MKYTKADLYNGLQFKIVTIWTISDINFLTNKCVVTSNESCEEWSLDHIVSSINSGSWEVINYKKPEVILSYSIY